MTTLKDVLSAYENVLAAAPDMMAALDLMVRVFKRPGRLERLDRIDMQYAFDAATAALAKARGEAE